MNNGTILTGTGLTKKYGDLAVVKEVSLSLAAGEFVCLVGKSGCGKTTLLSMLSGLERPTAGKGHAWTGRILPAPRRMSWPSSAGTMWVSSSSPST